MACSVAPASKASSGMTTAAPWVSGGEVAHHTAEAVVEGHRHADAIGFGVLQRFADEPAVVQDVVVRERCAFRRPGRAGRVLNVGGIVELEAGFAAAKVGISCAVAPRDPFGPGQATWRAVTSQIDHVTQRRHALRLEPA